MLEREIREPRSNARVPKAGLEPAPVVKGGEGGSLRLPPDGARPEMRIEESLTPCVFRFHHFGTS